MLQGLIQISENFGDFVGASSAATLDAVDAKIVQLLSQIRPEAVALTDAFGFLDSQLKSAIGRSGRTPSDCLDLDRRGVLIEV